MNWLKRIATNDQALMRFMKFANTMSQIILALTIVGLVLALLDRMH